MQVNVGIQPASYCFPKYNITENQLCAGSLLPIIDSCDGRSFIHYFYSI